MARVTGTEKGVIRDAAIIAIYWMGDAAAPQQYGVCFPGAGFNIARQSMAESLAIANDMLIDSVEAESQREKVGGLFGVKDLTLRAQETLDRLDQTISRLESQASAAMQSARALMDEAKAVVAQLNLRPKP